MRTKLQPGETVALIVRKHWIVLAKPALFFFAVLFSFPFRHVRLAGFEAMVSYLFPYLLALSAGLLLYRYLDRKVNIWVVTTSRLIDEWGLVSRRLRWFLRMLHRVTEVMLPGSDVPRLWRSAKHFPCSPFPSTRR
jgi:hypothetical protein